MFTIGCGVTAAQGPPAPQDLHICSKSHFSDLSLSAVCNELSELLAHSCRIFLCYPDDSFHRMTGKLTRDLEAEMAAVVLGEVCS